MVEHFIIMSSSYSKGKRIALDFTSKEDVEKGIFSETIKAIQKKCGDDVSLSTHYLQIKDDKWSSVQEYDHFFKGVELIETEEEFSELIKKDRVLSGLDVAKYILSKIRCTHLSLEKLVYFAYADYLCEYSQPLFADKIYAFDYGPVVESVYESYKQSGYKYFGKDTDEGLRSIEDDMPMRSRILFASDGIRKLFSIDRTIAKYGKCSASELVGRTHRDGSPWSHIDSSKQYQAIPDDIIQKYHSVEA